MIIILGIVIALLSADYSELDSFNSLVLEAGDFSPSMEARNFISPGQQFGSYEIEFGQERIDAVGDGSYAVIIYRLADNGHRVYLNDTLIGAAGNMADGNSNLWNGMFLYSFDHNQLQETNVLRIETTGIYRTGLSSTPIYITDLDRGLAFAGTRSLYGDQVNLFTIGFILFSSLITIVFYFIAPKRDYTFILISAATLMTGIYFSDYLVHGTLPVRYLIYKKMTMGSLYFGTAFYTIIVSRYFKVRWLKWMGNMTMISTAVMLLAVNDMVAFKEVYTMGYLMLLANILSWMAVSFRYMQKRLTAYIFFMSFTGIGVYAGAVALIDIFGGYFDFNSPVFYIVMFAVIPLLLIYEAIQEQNMMLMKEKDLREQEFLNSVTDSLTGTWNQRYFSTILKEHMSDYTMALVDLDDFKRINDIHGHMAGDYVLKQVAEMIVSNLRKSDLVCRYGGDEFVVIMKECSQQEAYGILETIRGAVDDYQFTFAGQIIDCTISAGVFENVDDSDVEAVFNKVDALLYRAKGDGKNMVASLDR